MLDSDEDCYMLCKAIKAQKSLYQIVKFKFGEEVAKKSLVTL